MQIKYRVLDVNKDENTVEVRYFTDFLTEDALADHFDTEGSIVRTANGYPVRCRTDYNLLIDSYNPSEEYTVNLLEKHAPVEWFSIREHTMLHMDDINLSNVVSIIGKVNSFEYIPPTSPGPVEFDINDILTPNNILKLANALKIDLK